VYQHFIHPKSSQREVEEEHLAFEECDAGGMCVVYMYTFAKDIEDGGG
jgi:hypothetical protein